MKRGFILASLAELALILLALSACGSEKGVQSLGEESTSGLDMVAYVLDGAIYVKSLADAEVVRLTEGVNPRFSAGGDRVLFDRDGAMWEINVDGSNEARLPAAEDDSGISPDGTRRLHVEVVMDATSVFGRYQRLHVVDLERGTDAVLYESRDGGIIPEGWTADSRYVLFWNDIQFSASLMADGTDLMAIPAVGGEPRALYRGLTRPGMVSAVPSGATLAVTEGVGRESWTGKRIALVDVDSGAVTELTSADRASLEPRWSPDGRRIAFVSQPDKKEGLASGKIPELTRDRRVWVMNADGSGQRQLTDDPAYRDERPLWSADGSQILFARLDENMKASLWLMPSDGGEAKQVVDAFGPTAGVDYYGATDWGSLYDWWQPPASLDAFPDATPEPTDIPASLSARRTGITAIDVVVDAVLSGDREALRPLVQFTAIGCTTNPYGIGGPPLCRPDEADGTIVDAFPTGSCEGYYLRPDELNTLLLSLTSRGTWLYAAYRIHASQLPVATDYVAVLSEDIPDLGIIAEETLRHGRKVGRCIHGLRKHAGKCRARRAGRGLRPRAAMRVGAGWLGRWRWRQVTLALI